MAAKLFFLFLILAVPLLILFPGFSQFIYPAGSSYSDLTITHLPNLVYLKESLAAWGEIPLWSTTILSGYPFAANPLSGLWYPFTWILLFLPQPFGYNLIISLHLLFGGLGVWLLLRRSGKGFWAAAVGAISFELMPKIISHYAAGHVTLVFAVCFTPWLLLAEMKRKTEPFGFWRFMPGLILGWIALADMRWIPYAGFAWLVIALDRLYFRKKSSGNVEAERNQQKTSSKYLAQLGGLFTQFFVAVGAAAPMLLPLIQYSSLSTRNNLDTGDRLALSLPPIRLLNLAFPDIGGNSEWVIYPGVFSLLALIVILSVREQRRSNGIWLFFVFISFFIAFGSYNPLMPLISRFPGYDYLRVPTRAIFLGGLSFSMMAGAFADMLISSCSRRKVPILPVFAASILSIGLFLGYWQLSGKFNFELFWGAGLISVFSLVFFFLRNEKFQKSFLAASILVPLVVLDVGIAAHGAFQLRTPESVYAEGRAAAEWLNFDADEPFRIYSPSYSIPQLTGAQYRLELADGIDPMQLESYAEFMSKAAGVESEDYSVTLPPFETGHPEIDNQDASPDPAMLGILNVLYVVSAFPVEEKGLELVEFINSVWIYRNDYFRTRAWIQQSTSLQVPYSSLEILERQPNRISLVAEGPGVVVLSEVDYPGWIAYVNGEKSSVLRIGGLLRGVEIEKGQNEISFVFNPLPVYTGLLIAAVTWLFFIAWLMIAWVKNRKNKHAD